jgi:hypothetical protein
VGIARDRWAVKPLACRRTLVLIANLRGIQEEKTERPGPKAPNALADVVDRCLDHWILSKKHLNFMERLRNHWPQWFAQSLFATCCPKRWDRHQTLWIAVPHPVLKQQIQFHLEELKTQLNQLLGRPQGKKLCLWVEEKPNDQD